MPGSAQLSDFLHLHANVTRRVRNLETGVHPTSTEDPGLDNYPPTPITITNPHFQAYMAFTGAPAPPRWQRRAGVVTLIGGVEPASGGWAAISGEETIGTLPDPARPLTEMIFNGAMSTTPYLCQYRVKPDGELSILKPTGLTGTDGVRLEGANWTTD